MQVFHIPGVHFFFVKMNTYVTLFLGVTVKRLVWSQWTFLESTTVANIRCVSSFMGSIVVGMGIYVDIGFYVCMFKCPWDVASYFGKYL